MIFAAYGHPNVLATHKTTIEFTKDKELTKEGDCIIGVNSDFSLNQLKEIIKKKINNKKPLKIIIKVGDLEEEVICEVNPGFNDNEEMVIRKTDFVSERTFGVNADKAAFELSRELIDKLKNNGQKIVVEIEGFS